MQVVSHPFLSVQALKDSCPVEHQLQLIYAGQCNNIIALDLRSCPYVLDDHVVTIFDRLHDLQELQLDSPNIQRVSRSFLCTLNKSPLLAPSLQKLVMSRACRLQALMLDAPNLKILAIDHCPLLSKFSVRTLQLAEARVDENCPLTRIEKWVINRTHWLGLTNFHLDELESECHKELCNMLERLRTSASVTCRYREITTIHKYIQTVWTTAYEGVRYVHTAHPLTLLQIEAIAPLSHLVECSFRMTGIKNDQVERLCEVLKGHQNLQLLDLSLTRVKTRGARAAIEFAKTHPALRILNLSLNCLYWTIEEYQECCRGLPERVTVIKPTLMGGKFRLLLQSVGLVGRYTVQTDA